jgi:hypothetical protein
MRPDSRRCGGIGRRSRLKICRRKSYRFDSGHRHHPGPGQTRASQRASRKRQAQHGRKSATWCARRPRSGRAGGGLRKNAARLEAPVFTTHPRSRRGAATRSRSDSCPTTQRCPLEAVLASAIHAPPAAGNAGTSNTALLPVGCLRLPSRDARRESIGRSVNSRTGRLRLRGRRDCWPATRRATLSSLQMAGAPAT